MKQTNLQKSLISYKVSVDYKYKILSFQILRKHLINFKKTIKRHFMITQTYVKIKLQMWEQGY